MKTFTLISSFLIAGLLAANSTHSIQDERIAPGNLFTLSFPDLPKAGKDQPAVCQVRIPDDYSPDKPSPLLVWIAGGKGSHKVSGAKNVVDPDKFIIVGLPLPAGLTPSKDHTSAKKMELAWELQEPMLEKIQTLIPNIHPDIRIVGGNSNGAHVIGTALEQKWKGFYDYFTGFILHEGGAAPSGDYRGAKKKNVLVVYGAKSPFLGWQKGFNENISNARAELTMARMPNAKHGMTEACRKEMYQWLIDTFPELETIE